MRKALFALLMFIGLAFEGSTQPPAGKPITTGISATLHSQILGEDRTLSIYLPVSYSKDDTTTYPVIYLLDGGVDEDFMYVAGLVRYCTQPWVARFPPSILIGIENTDRKRDLSFAVKDLNFLDRIGFKKADIPTYGGSGNFIAFLEQELQPWVSRNYRIANQKTIIGESFAGLLATEILLKHRNLFDTYIIMTPSLWWGRESLLKEAPALLAIPAHKDVKVYVGACSKEEQKIMYDDAVALSEVLKKYGGARMRVHYDYLPDEKHATIIYQATYNAFKMLYPLPSGQH